MAKIKLEFKSQRELDNFVTEYIANSIRHAQGADEDIESLEQYVERSFEQATRWSDTKRCQISIQDMQTNHLFNALAQKIVDLRNIKGHGLVEDFVLASLVWHCWKRVVENIKENVLCED